MVLACVLKGPNHRFHPVPLILQLPDPGSDGPAALR
jgi:hypothetical protein